MNQDTRPVIIGVPHNATPGFQGAALPDGLTEYFWGQPVASMLHDALRERGVNAVVFDAGPCQSDIEEAAKAKQFVRERDARMFVSLHFNHRPEPPRDDDNRVPADYQPPPNDYAMVYCDSRRPGSRKLAEGAAVALIDSDWPVRLIRWRVPPGHAGVVPVPSDFRGALWHNRLSCDWIVVEGFFGDHPEHVKLARSPEAMRLLTTAVAGAISGSLAADRPEARPGAPRPF